MDKQIDQSLPAHDSECFPQTLESWRFKTLIFTVLASIIGYFLFTIWAGWSHVLEATSRVGYFGIAVALSLSFANFCLRFLRWQLFFKAMGHCLPWKPSFRIYLSGFALTTTPGKTGEALRGIFLKDYDVPFRKSFGAFLSERFCDLMAVMVLSICGLWAYPHARPVLLVVSLLLSLILTSIFKDAWRIRIIHWMSRFLPKQLSKFIHFFEQMLSAFQCCFSKPIFLQVILLSLSAWMAEAISLYFLLTFVGFEVSLTTAVFIYGFSLVIGGITLLPGGLGGAEVTMLQLLMSQGIPNSAAVAITLVIRLTTLWFSVLLGFIVLPKKQMFWSNKKLQIP